MDVAVIAEAHVRATHAAAAGGQRILVLSGTFFYQEIRKLYTTFLLSGWNPDGFKKKLIWQRSSEFQMCPEECLDRRRASRLSLIFSRRKLRSCLG